MPTINISRNTDIKASAKTIRSILLDFKQWPAWSPWLIQEPECHVTFAQDGSSYSWEGTRIGLGSMRILDAGEHTLKYDLSFLKPWRSKATVIFSLEEHEESTNVSWSMESQLPFFLFWMKKMMEAFVGMDYERGLSMLKAYAEEGEVPSSLEFIGRTEYSGCHYLGIKNQSTMASIGDTMDADAKKLSEYIDTLSMPTKGPMFSIYHKYDLVKDHVEYTLGWPIEDTLPSLASGFIQGNIPKIKAYKLAHIGAYPLLGNAWSALYSMARAKEIKCAKTPHPFEMYMNMPGEVNDAELRTEIYFPLK